MNYDQGAAVGEGLSGLIAHEAEVRRQLDMLRLPAANWPIEHRAADGRRILDVVVVGAGMYGVAAAGSLILKGVRNIQVLDRSPSGSEGPWMTYARMPTLRSPKELPGPALGIPGLTYRAWHEARYGVAAWEALYKVFNRDWVDYLSWVQRMLGMPMRHEVEVLRVEAAGGLLKVATRGAAGEGAVLARRVVLATGRGGCGGNAMPSFVDRALWPDRAAHTNEPIDFARLHGKSIVTIGAGPSAWDNSATALELGAARVDMLLRRKVLPQVNKGRGSAFPGFMIGWSSLPMAERWATMRWLEEIQGPVPHETVLRTIAQQNFHIHFETPVRTVRRRADGVMVVTADGRELPFDFAIIGTGFNIDPGLVAELGPLADHIRCWGDCYQPPAGLESPGLAKFPFLGPGFELLEREPGTAPELGLIHLFNYGAHATQGAIASDVPGVNIGAERLSDAIVKALFCEDFPAFRKRLEEFDEPELESTPFYVPPDQR